MRVSTQDPANTASQLRRPASVLSDVPLDAPRLIPSKQLTSEELSQIIAVPVRTIEGWRRRGGGPPFTRVGRRGVRYDLARVREWLRRNTSVTA